MEASTAQTAAAATAIAGGIRADTAVSHVAQIFKGHILRREEARLVPLYDQLRILSWIAKRIVITTPPLHNDINKGN